MCAHRVRGRHVVKNTCVLQRVRTTLMMEFVKHICVMRVRETHIYDERVRETYLCVMIELVKHTCVMREFLEHVCG